MIKLKIEKLVKITYNKNKKSKQRREYDLLILHFFKV